MITIIITFVTFIINCNFLFVLDEESRASIINHGAPYGPPVGAPPYPSSVKQDLQFPSGLLESLGQIGGRDDTMGAPGGSKTHLTPQDLVLSCCW